MIYFLLILATYRLSRLISVDLGPFDCFEKVRLFFGKRASKNIVWKTLADLVHCQFCTGIWIALVLVLIFTNEYPWWLNWFSVAGGQAVISDFVMRGEA